MIIIDNNTIILLELVWVGAEVLNRTRMLRDMHGCNLQEILLMGPFFTVVRSGVDNKSIDRFWSNPSLHISKLLVYGSLLNSVSMY